MDVLTIVVSFNSARELLVSLDSLISQARLRSHAIFVWENGADVEIRGLRLGETRQVEGKVVRYLGGVGNLGYAPAVQRAAAAADLSHFDLIHLANPDTFAEAEDVLFRLADEAYRRQSITGPRMTDVHGLPRPSAYPLMRPYNVPLSYVMTGFMSRYVGKRGWGASRSVGTLDGSYLVCPRDPWRRLGGLDAGLYLNTDDHDLALRARRAGVMRWFEGSVGVQHAGGTSRGSRATLCALEKYRGAVRFVRRSYGAQAEARVRKWTQLALRRSDDEFSSALRWWARAAPVDLMTDLDLSVEDKYLLFLREHTVKSAQHLVAILRDEFRQ